MGDRARSPVCIISGANHAGMEKPLTSTEEDIMQMALLQHHCDQMMFWINYKEVIVWPEELGSVGSESQSALKAKYAKFHDEITAQEVKIDEVIRMADGMIQSSHPEEMLIMRRREELKISWQRMRKLALKRQMFDQELAHAQQAQAEEVKEKSLQQLMVKRQRKLADSLRAQQLFRDIDVEETWIGDKHLVIAGRGQDIASVKQLIKETQSIMMEMQSHDPYVQKVIQAGFKLAEGHYLAEDIRQRSQTLADHWAELKEKAFQRKQSNQLVLLFLFNIKD